MSHGKNVSPVATLPPKGYVSALDDEGKLDLIENSNPRRIRFKLFEFDRRVSSQDVAMAMKAEGFQPAFASDGKEFLAACTDESAFFDEQSQSPETVIICLGSAPQIFGPPQLEITLLGDSSEEARKLQFWDCDVSGWRFLGTQEVTDT